MTLLTDLDRLRAICLADAPTGDDDFHQGVYADALEEAGRGEEAAAWRALGDRKPYQDRIFPDKWWWFKVGSTMHHRYHNVVEIQLAVLPEPVFMLLPEDDDGDKAIEFRVLSWRTRPAALLAAVEAYRRWREMFAVEEEIRPLQSNPGYAVSAHGRVFSCRPLSRKPNETIRELRVWTNAFGYACVQLQKDGKQRYHAVHALVASEFLPRPASGQTVVRHLNGKPGDNRASNLAWGTQADNVNDAIMHGTTLKGKKNPSAKLNDRRVRLIRGLCAEGFSQSIVAHLFGISEETVRRACIGENWSHVDA